MRILLKFELKESVLPIEYRKVFMSFIKNALSKCKDGKYFDKYYKDTNQKDFTWTLVAGKLKFLKDKILLEDNNFNVIISTDDKQNTGLLLMMAFMERKFEKFPLENDNYIILNSVTQINQEVILKDNCVFKTIKGSAIVVREHNKENNKDKYYSCEDDCFNEKLTTALKNQANIAGFDNDSIEQISAEFIQGKKVVIKNYNIYIDATVGFIRINSSNIILQHFYQVGIASKRSAGFGMLEIIE